MNISLLISENVFFKVKNKEIQHYLVQTDRMLFRVVSSSSAYIVIFLLFLGDGVEIIFSSRS